MRRDGGEESGGMKFLKSIYGRGERFWGAEATVDGTLINRKL